MTNVITKQQLKPYKSRETAGFARIRRTCGCWVGKTLTPPTKAKGVSVRSRVRLLHDALHRGLGESEAGWAAGCLLIIADDSPMKLNKAATAAARRPGTIFTISLCSGHSADVLRRACLPVFCFPLKCTAELFPGSKCPEAGAGDPRQARTTAHKPDDSIR